MTYSLTVKLSSFSNWRLVHLCWTVAQNDNFIIHRLRAIPLTCHITLPLSTALPLAIDYHENKVELLLISNFVCSGMLAIHYILPQSDQLDLTLNLNRESELQKKWRHNLFLWTGCSKVTRAGHFLKMLNRMNLQQWHCQGQPALPSRLSALSTSDPSRKHEGWLWKFFYTWLVLTSANILPDRSIFRGRSHTCTANRQCSKCPTPFPACSPCRNISESII